ncbi:MAG: phenylalanine 4-monooxygenase [Gammaproteobacteria bacterium RIFCSPHIGHO2_12_FULL_42_13]|nr:MAG: phenylalanine 4-monooxygenase [Gammaproteobacteria bacterium RIFCSPHIGHO2_12_FULL_42_13]
MAKKPSTYVAKPVDENGIAHYTADDNQTWHELITRQTPILNNRACDEYMHGLGLLNLPDDRIPQCHEVNAILQSTTGWAIEPVAALIPFDKFFTLLANRKFPAATFIRRRDELDYLQEPDMFHEVFGHCPLLTNQAYADFTYTYGKLGLKASPEDRAMLAKLYWFTIEFGLIESAKGTRIYGGGILSSYNETLYALESKTPERKSFEPLEVLRTPYRIDIIQPIYYVIKNFDTLFHLTDMDLIGLIREARHLGMHKPVYSTE